LPFAAIYTDHETEREGIIVSALDESPSPRAVYRHAELARVLAPGSVAIVGASPTPGSPGYETRVNLGHFKGHVYLVNSRYKNIGATPCHGSLRDLPEIPDCVVVAVARDRVEQIVEEAADLGCGGAVIYAAGYAETAVEENIRKQRRLTAISRASNLRIVGPNCIGLANHVHRAGVTFTSGFSFSPPAGTAVGIVSQSGGLGNGLTQSVLQGVALSHTLTPGNSCDVDCADFVAYLAEEPSCRAIALTFEGVNSTTRLLQAGKLALRSGKPLVVFKLGRGERGAAAALSHSGFLAGSDEAYRAAFERMGAIVVEDYEHLLETAAFFAKAPRARSGGAAIVSVSGGTGVHAADVAEVAAVELPDPDAATRKQLYMHMPDFGSASNPVDVTAGNQSFKRLVACVDILLGREEFSIAVVPHLYSRDNAVDEEMYVDLARLVRKHQKPVAVTWMNGWAGSPGAIQINADPSLALFRSTRSCFNAIAAWQNRRNDEVHPAKAPRITGDSETRRARSTMASITSRLLTERESKRVLSIYGIPVVGEHLATTADEAVQAAAKLGYPVAVKLESADVPHKTEAGVIRLNIKNEAELRFAIAAIYENASRILPPVRVNGILVQPMIPSGVEIMVGARVDPLFGPLVVVGLGGIMVEVKRDSIVALAPLGESEALKMLSRLRGQALLNGPRGTPKVDRSKLADVIVRLSKFISDHGDEISEIDINPLVCNADGIVAVDALIVRR